MTTPVADRPDEEPTAERALVRRLRHLARGDRALLNAARRWTPGVVDPKVVAITRDAVTVTQVQTFPVIAAAFIAHTPAGRPSPGLPGVCLGKALRRTGPNDPATVRALDRLVTATTLADLHTAVLAVATLTRGRITPDWELTARQVTDWADPATRDQVRMGWARAFYARTPRTTGKPTPTQESSDDADE